ncbi:hypothetical protein [Spirosoma pomorum]
MKSYQTYLFFSLLAGLLALVVAKPWGQLNSVVGIESTADSLRLDSMATAQIDSLFIDEVAVALPEIVGDSLSYTVEARKKKKAYLEEQSALLQKENQVLDAALKKKQKSIQEKQQSLVSLDEIERLLIKQRGQQNASKLPVSDAGSELSQREDTRRDP